MHDPSFFSIESSMINKKLILSIKKLNKNFHHKMIKGLLHVKKAWNFSEFKNQCSCTLDLKHTFTVMKRKKRKLEKKV